METIRDFLEVRSQPTVVKLDDLKDHADRIHRSFLLTQDAQAHLDAIETAFKRPSGIGMFLIGHYGSGKSHFLGFLVQHLAVHQDRAKEKRSCVPISLLNYDSKQTLESIIARELNLNRHPDRRQTWQEWFDQNPSGLILIMDELSEFLRSKLSSAAFHEDIRFLQFLGEWSQNHPFWILAALQEEIEHTGKLSYEIYKKIKDRFPLRFFLTPTHVKDIIAKKLLIKKKGYTQAVSTLIQDLHRAFPGMDLQEEILKVIYPIHPMTMALLEEVRSLFSEARGMVDFTVNQLNGNPERRIKPFLDEDWGRLVSPDHIVAHFRDLLEMQGDFQKFSRQLFPRLNRVLPELFPKPSLRVLAEKLISCLVLVHLSPTRTHLSLDEAVWWLLVKMTTLAPEKNRSIIKKVLDQLSEGTGLVQKSDRGYALHFGENELDSLERWLAQEDRAQTGAPHVIMDQLLSLFPPISGVLHPVYKENWQTHHFKWHFHPRSYQITRGQPRLAASKTPSLVVLLPWEQVETRHMDAYYYVPLPIEFTPDLRECANLANLQEKPMSSSLRKRYQERLKRRVSHFHELLELAYRQGKLYAPDGSTCHLQQITQNRKNALDQLGESMFSHRFPRFTEFAPFSGPLNKKDLITWVQETEQDGYSSPMGSRTGKMIAEAYLVPMKLLQRRASQLVVPPNIEKNELVEKLTVMLDHNPTPKKVYRAFQEPLYGLVPDQISLFLIYMHTIGEIDLIKNHKSYRDCYQSLPNPIHYDRIVKVQILSLEQVKQFQIICEGLSIPFPQRPGDILHQKKAVRALKRYATRQEIECSDFMLTLQNLQGTEELRDRIQKHIQIWQSLEKGNGELDQIQHFLFQVASPMNFLQNHAQLNALPQRFQELVQRRQRTEHFLHHPSIQSCPVSEIQKNFQTLTTVPNYADPDILETWLDQATIVFEGYRNWYLEAHQSFWLEHSELLLPGVNVEQLLELAHLPELGLNQEIAQFTEFRRQFLEKQCRGISDLNFSPQCHCGFDGKSSPAILPFNQAREILHDLFDATRRFFQNPEVREKIRSWKDLGLDPTGGTHEFLAEKQDFPTIVDPQAFHQFMEGITVVQDVPLSLFERLVQGRTWRKDQLLEEFSGLLRTLGDRIRFQTSEDRTGLDKTHDLLNYAMESALKSGTHVPMIVSQLLEKHQSQLVIPKKSWVSSKTMKNLTEMELPEFLENQILVWTREEKLKIPEKLPMDSPLSLIKTWQRNTLPASPMSRCVFVRNAYAWTQRFEYLFGGDWNDFMDATTVWPWAEKELQSLLESHNEAEWLIIDAMGIPFQPMVEELLKKTFPGYQIQDTGTAMGPKKSSTDGFYAELLAKNWNKPFEKINDLDELLHVNQGPFRELERIASLKLEIRLEKYAKKNHPKTLLVFADHGFRYHTDGQSWTHSGGTNLERSFPYWLLKR